MIGKNSCNCNQLWQKISMSAHKMHFYFQYQASVDQSATAPARHPVIIIGAGPVGLSLAIDLAQRNIPVVLLDDADRIGEGSRAICFAKKTLEVFDRLGCADPMLEKGVRWSVGRVFQGEEELYQFNLLPENGHKMPAFINLQQYYVEKHLVDRAQELPLIDLRWRNKVSSINHADDHARLTVQTPDGPYILEADWLIACDGARSPSRTMLGLDFEGEVFDDQFLIADVKMLADFPVERWFWFQPPFHAGQSALLHKQPDDIWRIDLQLGRDADAQAEKKPENVIPRIKRMLGHDQFELEWVSVYQFQCRRLENFIHNRVIFAGDSAHQVSPFGARGANSGVQDAENLGWKLALVIKAQAGQELIASYNSERSEAADENIRNSTRSTDFLAPHTNAEKQFRNAALALAKHTNFAKRMVNSGRLSVASHYHVSPLSTADSDVWDGGVAPGSPIADCAMKDPDGKSLFLSEIMGPDFTLLHGASITPPHMADVKSIRIGQGAYVDSEALVETRYSLTPDAAYLIRPDGHVAARFKRLEMDKLQAALNRAKGG
jgi:3-(3-hydroxy-phenyl)propionate hydroxylase